MLNVMRSYLVSKDGVKGAAVKSPIIPCKRMWFPMTLISSFVFEEKDKLHIALQEFPGAFLTLHRALPEASAKKENYLDFQVIPHSPSPRKAMHCLAQYNTAEAMDFRTARLHATLAALRVSDCAVMVVSGFSKVRLKSSACSMA